MRVLSLFAGIGGMDLQCSKQHRRTAVSEWQPISTAPDDGTRVLLVNPLGWVGSGEFKDGFQGPGFYFEGNTLKSHPTHWQYLPPPPEVK